MNKYFRYFNKTIEFDIRTVLNMILFYFRKIPLLKHLSPSENYRMNNIKSFFTLLGPITLIIIEFFKSFIIYGFIALILYVYGDIFNFKSDLGNLFLITIFGFYVLNINNFYLEKNERKVYTLYEFFHVSPKFSIISGSYIGNFLKFVGRFLSLFLLGKLLNLENKTVFIITLSDYMTSNIFNALNIFLLNKDIVKPERHGIFYLSKLIGLLFVIFSLMFSLDIENILYSKIFLLIIFISFIFTLIYHGKFNGYTNLLLEYIDSKFYKNENKDKTLNSINLKTEDLYKSEKYIGEKLTGYNLLNELFFQRHRRIILDPILGKTLVLGIIMALVIILEFLPADFLPFNTNNASNNILRLFIKFIPFIAYLAFYNNMISKIMFVNCDEALMEYGFYRRPKDLLKMFTLRLKKLTSWNGLPFLIFLIFMIVFYFLGKVSLSNMGLFILEFGSMWIFFSVHTLFIYYIFQPYNDEYELKSPAYHIINFLVYFICFQVTQLNLDSSKVAIGFIIAAIIYSIIALILVYIFAPRTFKPNIRK